MHKPFKLTQLALTQYNRMDMCHRPFPIHICGMKYQTKKGSVHFFFIIICNWYPSNVLLLSSC